MIYNTLILRNLKNINSIQFNSNSNSNSNSKLLKGRLWIHKTFRVVVGSYLIVIVIVIVIVRVIS